MAVAERRALAWIDGVSLPDEALTFTPWGSVRSNDYDLTHCKNAIGTPLSLRTMVDDPQSLLTWLLGDGARRENRSLGSLLRHDSYPSVERWSKACNQLPPSPPLLHGGRMAALWRLHSPLGRGDVVASLLIGDRWGPGRWKGSQGGLVAIGLKRNGDPWKLAEGSRLDTAWLAAITAGADAHLAMEIQLRSYARRAAGHLARRRRPGRLKDLLIFAMGRPSITSSQVSRQLGLTSAGAIKLLAIAEAEGLLIERTGQASFRSYMVPVSGPGQSRICGRLPQSNPFALSSFEDDAEMAGPPEPF